MHSPVYSCFLVASKVFNHVNRRILFKKMKECNIPTVIIRILVYWYREQTISIKWGDSISECVQVLNGVQQGGVMSPKLFAIYVNGLSISLINSEIGCEINEVVYNHIFLC